jgi:hypothetical protein
MPLMFKEEPTSIPSTSILRSAAAVPEMPSVLGAGVHQPHLRSNQEVSSSEDEEEGDPLMAVGGASDTLEMARSLFTAIVRDGDLHGVPPSGPGRPSPARAAAAAFLLEHICRQYPQYEHALSLVSDVVLRAIFVPDTTNSRQLLGSVQRKIPLPTELSQQYGRLLRPYARKTYFEAHQQLSKGLLSHAKANRNIEMRLTRQSNIFEKTVKHWSSSVVRNHFVSWRQHTRRRRAIRDKYRNIFGRMKADECRVKALRMWRDRASKVKRNALSDAASTSELEGIHGSTAKMQEQINALHDYNNNLGAQITDLEEERQHLHQDVMSRERVVVELQLRVLDMERVGTALLDTALVRVPPPKGNSPIEVLVEWANQMVELSGGLPDGTHNVFASLLTEDHTVPSIPLAALAVVMLAFTDERRPSREDVVTLHISKDEIRVAHDLVQMTATMTGAPCLVTEEQLLSKQRGMILLYLASLLRHYTNWSVNKPNLHYGQSSPEYVSPEGAGPDQEEDDQENSSSNLAAQLDGAGTSEGTAAAKGVNGKKVLSSWAKRVTYQQQWVTTSMAALHAVLEIALHRPVQLTSEEQEDVGKFFDLPMSKLGDILPKGTRGTQYVTFLRSLQTVYADLRKIFAAYATPTLAYHDLLRLLKDCRLIQDRRFSRKQVLGIIAIVRGLGNVDGLSNEQIGHIELPPAAFTETICRLALAHTRRMNRDPNLMLTSSAIVNNFVIECIVPYALRSDVDRFKQAFRHPLVQQIISRNKISLRRAFHMYATEDGGEGVPLSQFQTLAKDCRWHSKTVTDDVIVDVFRRCQADNGGSFETLDLYEWLEALCAIAIYDNPNPLVPLHAKLAPFVEEKLLMALVV